MVMNSGAISADESFIVILMSSGSRVLKRRSRNLSPQLFSGTSKHGVCVCRRRGNRLDHIPVLDDLAAFQPKNVHHRLSPLSAEEPVPPGVQYHEIPVREHALNFATRLRMICIDPGGKLDDPFFAVFDERIVLPVRL